MVKFVFGGALLLGAGLVVLGSPLAGERPVKAHYFGSSEPILPMTFAHADHVTESCIECHHNYVDDTGNELCMTCHVTDPEVWPVLERQFHDFCRGCHTEKSSVQDDGGPPRQCMACHLEETLP